MYGIIYSITNKENGKQYVGQTKWLLRKRWDAHVRAANHKYSPKHYLFSNAIRKYGRDAFLLEQIDTAETLDDLNQKEKDWIAKLGTFGDGYNMTEGGGGIVGLRGEHHGMWGKGYLVSGDLNPMYGKTGEQHPMFGKHHSEETKAKLCAAWSDDRRLKFQNWSTNRSVSPETREKIGAASRGRKQSAETIKKRVQKMSGKLHPNAKPYKVTSPDGLEYLVKSLRHFCIEHGLNVQSMSNTVRRLQPITHGPYKGWMAQLT